MKNKSVVILTGNRNFFGQTRKPWVSMDVPKIEKFLTKNDCSVRTFSFSEIVNKNIPVKDSIIFYTFSQKLNRRNYLHDAIYFLSKNKNILIPSLDLLNCHENKGFQELFKREIGLHSLNSHYFSSKDELSEYEINYPVVYKTVAGSNAKGVYLARNEKELLKIIKRNTPGHVLTSLDLIRRKYFRKKKHYSLYPDYNNGEDYYLYKDYISNETNFILQQYVPDLSFDFRVLTLYDRYFIMKRTAKKNDFRASGTKIFSIEGDIDAKLLDYAKNIFDKFNTPFLSMDICQNEESFYLLEFQALHFGISAILMSHGYHIHKNGKWEYIKKQPGCIEDEISRALYKYIT